MRVTMILVRHGHVDGIDTLRFRGRQHLPLTPAGLRQAERTGAYVRRLVPHPAHIYSSPLTRCITTGTIIGQPLGLMPLPHEGLNDIDYGAWQGQLVADVARQNPAAVSRWFASPNEVTFPGGESLRALAERVGAALDAFVRENAGRSIVVVGHDSVNRVALLRALGLGLGEYWRLGQDPCAVNRLEHADGEWIVRSLNETAHLL